MEGVVFDDMRPHRLAPLSKGWIDQWPRLQYVYHGLINGPDNRKFIPHAPPDGPLLITHQKSTFFFVGHRFFLFLFSMVAEYGPFLFSPFKILYSFQT